MTGEAELQEHSRGCLYGVKQYDHPRYYLKMEGEEYGSKIARPEDVPGILKKHCDSEELNYLISFYFNSVK